MVPRVDADGNELGGVPTVLRDAPLGTYLGWNITAGPGEAQYDGRSEEHTSELQSRGHLVCRLLLEKKKVSCPPRSITRKAPSSTATRTNSTSISFPFSS